ncbi:MAG: ACT domain-containing protein [Candidatus Azobacteroides sp.]|nr:ACT domain-containing protein [Candidatus Azobacteroides sp.]
MIVKQLSIFLENKAGRLAEVASTLGEAGINMTAFSIAENTDFGILRLIVSDPEKAMAVLKENLFGVNLSNVLCLRCPNTPGALSKALEIIKKYDISIEYMYAFACGESANVIIRPDKLEECIRVFQEHKIELLAASDLYQL